MSLENKNIGIALTGSFCTFDKAFIEIENLVRLTNLILIQRGNLTSVLNNNDDEKTLESLLRVGTSAGGARAKAILAWNPITDEFRTGHLPARDGFEQWILKFDGISNNKDKELAESSTVAKIATVTHAN